MEGFVDDPDTACRAIYRETQEFIRKECQPTNLGFEILLGPPHVNPPIAFIGYQPGGWTPKNRVPRSPEDLLRYEQDWVTPVCQYAVEDWALARVMRDMFGKPLLEQCVGLNAIFVRARSVAEYEQLVTPDHRDKIRAFCLSRVRTILDVVRPQRVVVIGLETIDLFGGGRADLRSGKGRVLTKRGRVFGRDALATLHLSGARISTEDRKRIADCVLAL